MISSLVTIAGISFGLALSGAVIPGPMLTVTIGESMRRGFIAGPLIVLGHGVLELTLVVAIVNGLGTFLKRGPIIGTVAMAGSLILFWMGWGMIKQARKPTLLLEAQTAVWSRTLHPVVNGIFVSFSNPYWAIWWITIGLAYIMTAMEYGVMGIVAFFFGHILADLLWFSLISYGVTTGKKLFSEKLYQKIIEFCGLFLILFGVWFIIAGIRHFYCV
jgi:threonine/homoserine/homoserine lactone efflux protein